MSCLGLVPKLLTVSIDFRTTNCGCRANGISYTSYKKYLTPCGFACHSGFCPRKLNPSTRHRYSAIPYIFGFNGLSRLKGSVFFSIETPTVFSQRGQNSYESHSLSYTAGGLLYNYGKFNAPPMNLTTLVVIPPLVIDWLSPVDVMIRDTYVFVKVLMHFLYFTPRYNSWT